MVRPILNASCIPVCVSFVNQGKQNYQSIPALVPQIIPTDILWLESEHTIVGRLDEKISLFSGSSAFRQIGAIKIEIREAYTT